MTYASISHLIAILPPFKAEVSWLTSPAFASASLLDVPVDTVQSTAQYFKADEWARDFLQQLITDQRGQVAYGASSRIEDS